MSRQPLPSRGELSLVLPSQTVSTIQYLCKKQRSMNIFVFRLNATQSVLHFLHPLVQSAECRVQSGADRGTVVPLFTIWNVSGGTVIYKQRCFFLFFFICAALEGRAGMVAITLSKGRRFDSAAFYRHVVKFLPNYARPRFVRIQVRSIAVQHLFCGSCSARLVIYIYIYMSSSCLFAEFFGRHRHVQVHEDGAGEGGLRPQSDSGRAVFSGWKRAGLRPTHARDIHFGYIREDQNLDYVITCYVQDIQLLILFL